MSTDPAVALHLCAENDVNGNPRRVFVVLSGDGRFLAAIDEGYEGEQALFRDFPQFRGQFIQRLYVPVSEYRRQLRRDPISPDGQRGTGVPLSR